MLKAQVCDWELLPNYSSFLFDTKILDYSFLRFFFFNFGVGEWEWGREKSRKQ